MAIETIRLSEKAKKQLISVKRKTGIQNWNVMCRWAFCLSLAEPSKPPIEDIPSDSSVEMSWKVFAGIHQEVYTAMLRHRAHKENYPLDDTNDLKYFRLHLHRGISYLNSNDRSSSIRQLLAIVTR